jgi:hypothetical protein
VETRSFAPGVVVIEAVVESAGELVDMPLDSIVRGLQMLVMRLKAVELWKWIMHATTSERVVVKASIELAQILDSRATPSCRPHEFGWLENLFLLSFSHPSILPSLHTATAYPHPNNLTKARIR